MRTILLTAAVTFALDQASKWAVVHGLSLDRVGEIAVAPPYLVFRMGWNTGINFGLFGSESDAMRWILVGLAVAISGWLLWWGRHGLHRTAARVAAGLVIGGALGNALDRVVYGAVADFLNMSCCGIDNPFVFNLADTAIVAGAIGLVVLADAPRGDARR